jgi:hypothetical protein
LKITISYLLLSDYLPKDLYSVSQQLIIILKRKREIC